MNNEDEIELLRDKLEKLIATTESLVDCEVVSLSQELDNLISNYFLDMRSNQHNLESVDSVV